MTGERRRVLLAEGIGTCFLLVGVVGSGIMAERLSPDDVGLQLLENAAATAAVLIAIISIFGTISADFNPAVSLAAWLLGHRSGREVPGMVAMQVLGGCAGTVLGSGARCPHPNLRPSSLALRFLRHLGGHDADP
jgi:arsenate reductase